MTEYKIERFDSVINAEKIMPVIYILPDPEFLQFAEKNNYILACEINKTGTIYDGKIIPGLVTSGELTRPNFFKKNGFYTVTLFENWSGYPSFGSTGTIKFGAPESVSEQNDSQNTEQVIEKYNDIQSKNNIPYWFIIFLIFVCIFCTICLVRSCIF